MGIELAVSVVGIVAATVISLLTYGKMNPKRKLRYRVEVTPLLAASAAGRRLTVTFEGQPVTDPQLVTLSVWSSGRAGIGSDAFDAGTPLTFDLGAPLIGEALGEREDTPRLGVSLPDRVLLRPTLLHRTFQSTVRVVVDGPPTVRVNRVLANIEVLRDGVSDTARAIDRRGGGYG